MSNVNGESGVTPTESQTTGTVENLSRGSREPPATSASSKEADRSEKARGIIPTPKAMIEAMATKGYWTSPGGATPAQTLYSALIREISHKGDASRFVKADKGLFGLKQ